MLSWQVEESSPQISPDFSHRKFQISNRIPNQISPKINFRAGSWQNGFFADFYFWAAGFFRGFSRRIFSPGKSAQKNPPGKSPAKSSKIDTTKIPDTFLQRGLSPKNVTNTRICRLGSPRASCQLPRHPPGIQKPNC